MAPVGAGTFRWVSGWVQSRTGGGAHGVTGMVEHYEYACHRCIRVDRMHEKNPGAGEQGALL